jgi:hypothetical protein
MEQLLKWDPTCTKVVTTELLLGLDDMDNDIYIQSVSGLASYIPYLFDIQENESPRRSIESSASTEMDSSKTASITTRLRTSVSNALQPAQKPVAMRGAIKKQDLAELTIPELIENILIPQTLKIMLSEEFNSDQKWTIIDEVVLAWKKMCVAAPKVDFLLIQYFRKKLMYKNYCGPFKNVSMF